MLALSIIDVGKVNVSTVPGSMPPLLGSTCTLPASELGFSLSAERAIQGRKQNKINSARFIMGGWPAVSCFRHPDLRRRSGRFAFRTFLVRAGPHSIREWPANGFDIG